MANSFRNETEMKINNNTYKLKLNWDAVANIENTLPRSVLEILLSYSIEKKTPRFSELRTIILYSALAANPSVDAEQLDTDIMEEGIMALTVPTLAYISEVYKGAPKTAKTNEKKVT